jgi:hypothetical protein
MTTSNNSLERTGDAARFRDGVVSDGKVDLAAAGVFPAAQLEAVRRHGDLEVFSIQVERRIS